MTRPVLARAGCAHVAGLLLITLLLSGPAITADRRFCEVTPSAYWENTLTYPNDLFIVSAAGENPGWVKFTIMTCAPTTVYYQDSIHYPFHHNFITAELDPYLGITLEQFQQLAMYAAGQELIIGTVLLPGSPGFGPGDTAECGIQLIRRDPYTPDEVIALFNLVKSTINAAGNLTVYYMPTFEQWEVAQDNAVYLAEHGVVVSSTDRWASGNPVYSDGWSIGPLKYCPAGNIAAAYLAGTLLPTDIVLTDGVPAEMPFLAGILSLQPATPSSHVALLANTYGTPFAHLAIAADAAHAQALVGHKVALRAYAGWSWHGVRIVDVDGQLDDATIAEILALKTPAPLNIDPLQPYGAYSASAAGLVLADLPYFGGKASNYGFLRRILPDNSPVACAFSFDLWNAFMDQTLSGGSTLRAWIAAKLAPHTWPPNMAELADDLDDIRDKIKDDDETFFNAELQAAVLGTLQDPAYGFLPDANIRFRSSSNAEDSAQFVAAGLYDSFSGCLLDDLDGDNVGPSHCDPSENNERGVFRAIRKVFASFYNDHAYMERLRRGVNEDEVGMALLVHHSFPDEYELANGVATLVMGDEYNPTTVRLVTQLGAVSVTNPEGGATPEEVAVDLWPSPAANVYIRRYSSLVVLGETVMDFEDDYIALAQMMNAVAQEYAAVVGSTALTLDYEYKKVAPGGAAIPAGGLEIDQVRQLPRPDYTPSITPFLINEPVEYPVNQGGDLNAFANHRLKSRWHIETRNMWLTAENLQSSIFADVTMQYTDGCSVRMLAGQLSEFPGAWHTYDEWHTTTDGWTCDWLPNARHYRLLAYDVGELVAPSEPVWLTVRDLGYGLVTVQADYEEPVPIWTIENPGGTTTTDSIVIQPEWPPTPNDVICTRTITDPGQSITIHTTYRWATPASYYIPCPLGSWIETRIEGLTSTPIILHDWWSQSYATTNHNLQEQFVFEPRLEPGISPAVLAELDAQNVQVINAVLTHHPHGDVITLHSDDDCLTFPCDDSADCGHPDYPRYCAKPVGVCDDAGICALRPLACAPVWDPVCGCDGVSYPSACHAAMSGASVASYGFCTNGDLNGDGEVNGDDVALFCGCLDGPGLPPASSCEPADLDHDGDVDVADAYRYQWVFSEP